MYVSSVRMPTLGIRIITLQEIKHTEPDNTRHFESRRGTRQTQVHSCIKDCKLHMDSMLSSSSILMNQYATTYHDQYTCNCCSQQFRMLTFSSSTGPRKGSRLFSLCAFLVRKADVVSLMVYRQTQKTFQVRTNTRIWNCLLYTSPSPRDA